MEWKWSKKWNEFIPDGSFLFQNKNAYLPSLLINKEEKRGIN
jgi:hypothetical protein